MELIDALAQSFDHANSVVGNVRKEQLDADTPCRDWDLRALLGHMTAIVAAMGNGASGAELISIPDYELEPDFVTQFRTESSRTLAAWKARGLDGEINIGRGARPAPVMLTINLLDTTMHSWDVARATNQDAQLPPELATTVLGLCQGFVTDELRQSAGFDPAIATKSTNPSDQLAAFLGRNPR
jgi:uncharacterized protein (TIGR03086 family)